MEYLHKINISGFFIGFQNAEKKNLNSLNNDLMRDISKKFKTEILLGLY